MPVPVTVEPSKHAEVAGLDYISDNEAGIRRRRMGKGFTFTDVNDRPLRDADALVRIKALRIPPAWIDVWICPRPDGHLQATGRDARGRKQYIYHPRWSEVRDQTKFHRMIAFAKLLPTIRQRVENDLNLRGLSREKVLATVLSLLESTLIRVGNEEYARENNSYGLTTMRDEHVNIFGPKLRFFFRGKSGKEHDIQVQDKRLAKIVKRCQDLPGQELFQYLDAEGKRRAIGSADVNSYLQELTGEQFSAKDIRTWGGTVHAAHVLMEMEPADSDNKARKNIVQAVKKVALHLGNKPSTCRKYYIHPAILEAYMDGSLIPVMDRVMRRTKQVQPYELDPLEQAVLAVMKKFGSVVVREAC